MRDPSGFSLNVDKSKEFSSGVQENNFVEPVQPLQTGEGLPYAPTNWPNPGDTWGWRVGKRFNSSGYYSDRFLYLPCRLHKPNVPKQFASKLSLERYIQSEFPDADINAFWASFSWKVPALKNSTGVEATPLNAVYATPLGTVYATSPSAEKVEEGKEENPITSNRKRKHTAANSLANPRIQRFVRQVVPPTKDSSRVNVNEKGTSNAPKKDMKSKANLEDDQPDNGSFAGSDSPSECMAKDFNNYLDSLVENLAHPATDFHNKANATSWNKEKEKITQQLQAEINSKLSIVQEIDNQIAKLQSQRAKLLETIETEKGLIAKLSTDEQKLGNGKMMNQVDLNSGKPE